LINIENLQAKTAENAEVDCQNALPDSSKKICAGENELPCQFQVCEEQTGHFPGTEQEQSVSLAEIGRTGTPPKIHSR
jgi:hypothetical protein